MLYKCNNCSYTTQRACDLRRHQSRKYPCNRHSKDNTCNSKDDRNVSSESERINPESEIMNPQTEIMNPKSEIMNPESENMNPGSENMNPESKDVDTLKCSKCNKTFCRIDYLKLHEKKCDGFHKRQCRILSLIHI